MTIKCYDCGDELDKSEFYECHLENEQLKCKRCIDCFWEMMEDDPCGKDWQF